jgi:hypothetical protein
MRLTLRTLLAWLDDTLPPSEVREIGKQVAESPFAQELVERIHRVTRQRRLTIPSSTGPDASDPNLVAAYLDSGLEPDLVADYEKQCLTSDVHLAEVASVHQILSLIGQKAKVPNEAKSRMFNLVKGRESAARVEPKAGAAAAAAAPAPEPISEPIQPWVTPEPPSRPWIAQFGPALLVAALMAVLTASAWMSLRPSGPEPFGPVAKSDLDKSKPVPPGPAEANETVQHAAPAQRAEPIPPTPPAEEPASKPAAENPEPAQPAPKPAELPLGTSGIAAKPTGVLLRYNSDPEKRQWELLTDETPLKSQDRILNLKPFRNTLLLGGERARLDLVEETEVWVMTAPPTEAARLNLVQGRLALHAVDGGQPFVIQFAGRNVTITPPRGGVVGVERFTERERGSDQATGPYFRFYAPEGEVALAVDDSKQTLTGPGAISLIGAEWKEPETRPAPSWVTDSKPSPFDQKVGEQFASQIHPGQPIIRELVTAIEDPQADVRRLAIYALRAVGDISFVVPLLSKQDDPVMRKTTIHVLRAYLGQGAEAQTALRNELLNNLGPDISSVVEKLLIGYTPKEARDRSTYDSLVKLLESDQVAVRELALDNLQSLTGRDNLDYDPDRPEGRGLQAWKDLARERELRPAGTLKGEALVPKKAEVPAKKGENAAASRKTEK